MPLSLPEPGVERAVVAWMRVPALTPARRDALAALLPDDERCRAARFRFDRDRDIYVAAHGLLRAWLGALTGRADRAFRLGPQGKPALDPDWGAPPLRFNLSHTAGLVACAMARGHEVGVDAEAEDRRVDAASLASRVFTAAECRLLDGLAGDALVARFCGLWTLKEAVLKARGDGLSLPLTDFSVTLDPPGVGFAPRLAEDSARWQLDRLAPAGYRLALAVRRAAPAPLAVCWHEVAIDRLA